VQFQVRQGSDRHEDARNPLGYLPRRRAHAPQISSATLVPTEGDTAVVVSLQTTADDLGLNQVLLRIRDRSGKVTDARRVAFNEREHCGANATTDPGVRLDPEAFRRESGAYRLTVVFPGVSLPAGGTYEVLASDVTGRTSSTVVGA
jgi:hypothetical protein